MRNTSFYVRYYRVEDIVTHCQIIFKREFQLFFLEKFKGKMLKGLFRARNVRDNSGRIWVKNAMKWAKIKYTIYGVKFVIICTI